MKSEKESESQIKLQMKNRILFLGLLLIVFGLRIDAQTIKNIHRHNLPVLRIPTHLIDKVETAEVNGERVLKVIQLNGYVSQIPVSQIDSITHSLGEAVDPAQLGNLRTASVMGVVTGPTGAPEMNAIVRSPYGGEETRTDPNGVFFLNNILVYDKLGYITITKPGFHQGSRSFLPLETGSNRVNVQLLPMTQSGSFTASAGGTVTSGLLQLSFPANAIQLNGQPYSGIVNVFAEALDPTSTAMFDQMPGELLGGMNDSLRLLRSFGMASIELRDANMNELQLADSFFSTLTFTIPASLQAEAPASIDWWSFDEEQGIWMHEGMAQKQDNQYIGQASHFSWWNLDVPGTYNEFIGTIHSFGGSAISNAQINLVSPTLGTGITYTNSEGLFSSRVPINQTLNLSIYLTCNTLNDWTLVQSENFFSGTDPIIGAYTVTLTGNYPITGTVVTCSGQPIISGYVKMGLQIYPTIQGQYTIYACLGDNFIQGFENTFPDSIIASDLITVQVTSLGVEINDLSCCNQVFGFVTDVEGIIYPTIFIGNQVWMAENLRTAKYSNGDSIPNELNDIAWEQISSGAWCNYDNSIANDIIYGKYYNWYAMTDSRNVCPAGWHIPSNDEWILLADNLGGISVAGGKMKTISGWNGSNTGATNESSFSALPVGWRSNNGYFNNLGSVGWYWTSELLSRSLHSNSMYLGSAPESPTSGLTIRCVKD